MYSWLSLLLEPIRISPAILAGMPVKPTETPEQLHEHELEKEQWVRLQVQVSEYTPCMPLTYYGL